MHLNEYFMWTEDTEVVEAFYSPNEAIFFFFNKKLEDAYNEVRKTILVGFRQDSKFQNMVEYQIIGVGGVLLISEEVTGKR